MYEETVEQCNFAIIWKFPSPIAAISYSSLVFMTQKTDYTKHRIELLDY
jgi:hypothetical protein